MQGCHPVIQGCDPALPRDPEQHILDNVWMRTPDQMAGTIYEDEFSLFILQLRLRKFKIDSRYDLVFIALDNSGRNAQI